VTFGFVGARVWPGPGHEGCGTRRRPLPRPGMAGASGLARRLDAGAIPLGPELRLSAEDAERGARVAAALEQVARLFDADLRVSGDNYGGHNVAAKRPERVIASPDQLRRVRSVEFKEILLRNREIALGQNAAFLPAASRVRRRGTSCRRPVPLGEGSREDNAPPCARVPAPAASGPESRAPFHDGPAAAASAIAPTVVHRLASRRPVETPGNIASTGSYGGTGLR
jgi:hypothetical protein